MIDCNYTPGRNGHCVEGFVIHHTGGICSLEAVKNHFNNPRTKASAHYGIADHRIDQFVLDTDTAWACSNRELNQKTISIEVANSTESPEWEVSDQSLKTLIKLLDHLCRVHGIDYLEEGINLLWHSLYSKTICPGKYLLSKITEIRDTVNEKLLQCKPD